MPIICSATFFSVCITCNTWRTGLFFQQGKSNKIDLLDHAFLVSVSFPVGAFLCLTFLNLGFLPGILGPHLEDLFSISELESCLGGSLCSTPPNKKLEPFSNLKLCAEGKNLLWQWYTFFELAGRRRDSVSYPHIGHPK